MPVRFPLSPFLRQFVYDVLYKMSDEERDRLKGKYYPMRKKALTARAFADGAGLEEILHVLCVLGFEWTLLIWDNKEKPSAIRNILGEYDKDNPNLKKIIERRLYVTTERQFVYNLSLAAKALTTNIYKQNLELSKVGYHRYKWPAKLKTENIEQDEDGLESARYLSQTIIHSLFAIRQADSSEDDTLVLLYMFAYQHTYMTLEQMSIKFAGVLTRYRFTKATKRLVDHKLLEKHSTKKKFSITTLGINRALKVMNQVLGLNSFYP